MSTPTGSAPLPIRLVSGLRIVSLCTLCSRVLGLVRDVGMAALFGNGVVMDAFSVAFRIPNLGRRLFGEGALSTAFLPIFVHEITHADRNSAWKLASAVLTLLAVVLIGLVLLGEAMLWGTSLWGPHGPETDLLRGLTAIMLPYLIPICLAAQMGAMLNSQEHFTWPALLPVLLNVIWIVAIWGIAPLFTSQTEQIHSIALCIVVAGFVQFIAPWPTLWRLGFRYDSAWRSAGPKVIEVFRSMLPIAVGLSITQLNTLSDSLIAWGFSEPEFSEQGFVSLEAARSLSVKSWPLASGTASALYFGQRLYQFPLGVFGVALGTVLFPQLARHAESGRLDRLRDDLSLGLKLVIGIGLPASAGLMLLAGPLTSLLFQHGAFDAEDASQTTSMISAYGSAVWAYCGLLIVHRGYYAAGDRQTPLRIGLLIVCLNLALNFTLIWPLGGVGLALATAVCAMIQVITASWLIQRRIGRLDWRGLMRTTLRVVAATAVMSVVCFSLTELLGTGPGLLRRFLHVVVPLTASILTYFAMARWLHIEELWLLIRRNQT